MLAWDANMNGSSLYQKADIFTLRKNPYESILMIVLLSWSCLSHRNKYINPFPYCKLRTSLTTQYNSVSSLPSTHAFIMILEFCVLRFFSNCTVWNLAPRILPTTYPFTWLSSPHDSVRKPCDAFFKVLTWLSKLLSEVFLMLLVDASLTIFL